MKYMHIEKLDGDEAHHLQTAVSYLRMLGAHKREKADLNDDIVKQLQKTANALRHYSALSVKQADSLAYATVELESRIKQLYGETNV